MTGEPHCRLSLLELATGSEGRCGVDANGNHISAPFRLVEEHGSDEQGHRGDRHRDRHFDETDTTSADDGEGIAEARRRPPAAYDEDQATDAGEIPEGDHDR